MRKVVYISHTPLTNKTRREWLVDDIAATGRPVEYWDTVALWGYRPTSREADRGDSIIIRSFTDLGRRLEARQNREAIFILTMNYEPRFQALFRLLTRMNCTISVFEFGHMPYRPPTRARKILNLARNPLGLARAVVRKATATVSRRTQLIKPFDVVFAAGEAAAHVQPGAGRIVPINMPDYEHFLRSTEGKPRLVSGRYALFLDSNHAMHPDRAFLGVPPIDVDEYFSALNRFFGLLERKLGAPLVIALHPKSEYGSERFEGRQVFRDESPRLAKHAELVTCHLSTSMGFAVMAGAPIIYIYTSAMATSQPDYIGNTEGVSEYLGMPGINIDRVRADDFALPVPDPKRYAAYQRDFLSSNVPAGATTRDIVIAEFSRLDEESRDLRIADARKYPRPE